MKERPILFSAPMVQAVLDDRKGQTRRMLNPQPSLPGTFGLSPIWGRGVPLGKDAFHVHAAFDEGGKRVDRWLPCPYGQPGDRLWVRETWWDFGKAQQEWTLDNDGDWYWTGLNESASLKPLYLNPDQFHDAQGRTWTPAENLERRRSGQLFWRKRPSIHMPRWASRLTLEVTGVRVERLQDITEEDAKAEGAVFHDFGRQCGHRGGWLDVGDCPAPESTHPQRNGWTMEPPAPGPDHCMGSARMAFANLINKINGPEFWDLNPWVWVVEFRKAA